MNLYEVNVIEYHTLVIGGEDAESAGMDGLRLLASMGSIDDADGDVKTAVLELPPERWDTHEDGCYDEGGELDCCCRPFSDPSSLGHWVWENRALPLL